MLNKFKIVQESELKSISKSIYPISRIVFLTISSKFTNAFVVISPPMTTVFDFMYVSQATLESESTLIISSSIESEI